MKLNFYESFFYTFFVDTYDVQSVDHTDTNDGRLFCQCILNLFSTDSAWMYNKVTVIE